MSRPNDPAFPRPHSWDESPVQGIHEGDRPAPHAEQAGMTVREYAAIAAMQGILSADPIRIDGAPAPADDAAMVADFAVAHADALLAALEQSTPQRTPKVAL